MKRLVLALTLMIGAILIPSIAKADCGSQFIRAHATHFLALERIPQNKDQWTTQRNAITSLSGPIFQSCPDDSSAKQTATRMIWDLWGAAVNFENRLGYVHLVASNQIGEAPPSCAPALTDLTRSYFLNGWPSGIGTPVLDTNLPALKSVPYAGHVFELWRTIARRLAVSLPPMTQSQLARVAIVNRYSAKSSAEEAHLPDGVECGNL